MNYPEVNSREDFLRFVELLIDDFSAARESWENISIPEFLEAIHAWTKDGDASASSDGWKLVAQLLYAGSRYE